MDPFETLGLPPRFDLDPKEIEQRYRDLSRVLHPDKHVNESASSRRAALAKAVSVNEAYRLLRDEVTRGEALLRASGVVFDLEREGMSDPEFLSEVMDVRESLSEARASGDRARITALALQQEKAEGMARTTLLTAFRDTDFQRAKGQLAKLRYYRRFREELRAIDES